MFCAVVPVGKEHSSLNAADPVDFCRAFSIRGLTFAFL